MNSELHILRLGTRGSLLARTQSQLVASQLEKLHPGLAVELVIVKTSGDLITDKPLHDVGGKGLFTKELEQALLANDVDFAVHSYKDVPVTLPLVDASHLVIAATPLREDPRDVLAMRGDVSAAIPHLPQAARIGTGSLRRRCQLLAIRPDLVIEPIRGNIDTRLRKLDEGQYDAIILAFAGLHRTRLFESTRMAMLEPDAMVPAPGQGALALQCRAADDRTRGLLAAMHDPLTGLCVNAERELVRRLEGDCHSPIAALATAIGETVHLRAAVGARDGGLPVITASASGLVAHMDEVTEQCWESLAAQGAPRMLRKE